jgi:hypothetical protein
MTSIQTHTGMQSEDNALLQYESLRSWALNKQEIFCQRSLGRALFIRQGMLAWIELCRRCLPANLEQRERRDKPEIVHETTSEMIKVMANITLFNLEEAVS